MSSKKARGIIKEALLLGMTLLFLFPMYMVIVNSFKSEKDAAFFSIDFPKKLLIENYVTVFNEGHIVRSFLNGFSLAAITCILTIVLSSMAAFYIARAQNKLARLSYYFFISGLIIPVAIIPLFFMVVRMGLINTYSLLVLLFLTGSFPISVFIFTGFIKTIPRELDEAAIIDGVGKLGLFFQVIFPLLKSAIITIGIITFMGVWNDIMTQLYFATPEKWTMPMTVYRFMGMYSNQWNLVFADLIVTSIPTIIIYMIGQKYMVSGITAGAVKG